MKGKIIEILESVSFHITDEEGTLNVVSSEDFDDIAERILKLFTNIEK